MIGAIDQDHETAEEAALAALAAAEEIFVDRAKFVVVGQLCATRERMHVPVDDPEAVRLSLGWFSTEGDAIKAAGSLWHSTASGDQFRTWVLPVFHETPAAFHGKRKEQYIALQAKAKEKKREQMRLDIEKRNEQMQARADELQAMEEAAGGQQWPCPQALVTSGNCRHAPACK